MREVSKNWSRGPYKVKVNSYYDRLEILDDEGNKVATGTQTFPMNLVRDDANAHLLAASTDLYDALEGLEMLYSRENESANDTFERIAEVFYNETGYLRPGKSYPMGFEPPQDRLSIWNEWCAKKVNAARMAMAKAQGVDRAVSQ